MAIRHVLGDVRLTVIIRSQLTEYPCGKLTIPQWARDLACRLQSGDVRVLDDFLEHRDFLGDSRRMAFGVLGRHLESGGNKLLLIFGLGEDVEADLLEL